MVNEVTRDKLIRWAEKYNCKEFIANDPISFPHRFSLKQDIEISGFITAWISYGRRPLILKKAEELHSLFGESPYKWIMQDEKARIESCEGLRKQNANKLQTKSKQIANDCKQNANTRDTCYRFYTFSDFFDLTEQLHSIYKNYNSLEDALAVAEGDTIINKLQHLFAGVNGIPLANANSACKRLAMFLRWMVRNDGIVDLGIWNTHFSPQDLIIPLDTHVFRVSHELNLITHKTPVMAAAIELTEKMKEVFPSDPCLADFSLFGYGIDAV